MRLLLLLILAGVGAYFTVPTREAHETAARAYLEQQAGAPAADAGEPVPQDNAPFSLDSVVDFVTGMVAGRGRYESLYLASKYTLDLPGAAYLECWGGYTLVQCREVDRASQG
ncbi:MAG: hypothetical protein DCF16_12195 [Alphaproteobacteria bacterium]|nr:MAG: hypothetical protein DCF16_12195 [Alphaproteobacteria bacterium]